MKYLTVACEDKRPKSVRVENFRRVKGHLDELRQMARKGIKQGITYKRRAQTAVARRKTVA